MGAAVIAAAALATACGGTADAPTTTSTAGTSGVTSISTATRAVSLAALSPCQALSTGEVDKHGYGPGVLSTHSTSRACIFKPRNPGIGNTLFVGFGPDNLDTMQVPSADTVTSHIVGTHQAMRVRKSASPMCSMFIRIPGAQLVTVQASNFPDADAACAHVMEVVQPFEPFLP